MESAAARGELSEEARNVEVTFKMHILDRQHQAIAGTFQLEIVHPSSRVWLATIADSSDAKRSNPSKANLNNLASNTYCVRLTSDWPQLSDWQLNDKIFDHSFVCFWTEYMNIMWTADIQMKWRCDHLSAVHIIFICFIPFTGTMNSINWPAPNVWVFTAQLVEHCSANAEAMGSNPVEDPKTFSGLNLRLLKSQS